MINSLLERQAKSTDELLRRLLEEQDGKKYSDANVNPSSSTCAINFAQTNPHTSGPSAGSTAMTNPSAQPVNHFHSQTTIEGSVQLLNLGCHNKLWPVCMGKGTCTPHLALLIQTLVPPPIPPCIMVKRTLILMATIKLYTLS
jgi:hypothetical protein